MSRGLKASALYNTVDYKSYEGKSDVIHFSNLVNHSITGTTFKKCEKMIF
jgi:hypothetical protein